MKRPTSTNPHELNKYIDYLEEKVNSLDGKKPPNLPTLISYFRMNGYKESAAKKAFDYYENLRGNGRIWRDVKGTPIKNWKLKMKAVWFKPENKKQDEIQRGF